MSYTIEQLGYDRALVKSSLFNPITELYSQIQTSINHNISDGVSPTIIKSGDFIGNFNIVHGFLKSDNYVPGVNGFKFDNAGNLEANTAIIRGSIYATSGLIGGWVVDDDGLYYSGSGTPNIRTSEAVGSGADGVIMDKDGVRGYNATLGEVFNLHSDGSAPEFSFGSISESIFEINTNAVLRTSETVGDGTASSAGVLINETGFYACEADQTLATGNVRISTSGTAYFKGTVNASNIMSSEIYGSTINGAIITGGLLRTSESGQRTEINSAGIQLLNGASSGYTYGDADYLYGNIARTYGIGVLAYINSSIRAVPFYVQAEQTVADMHFPSRGSDPTGAAEIGDLCVVSGKFKICTVAGTPGTWTVVGDQTS